MITAWYDPGFAVDIGSHIMPMRKFALVAEQIAEHQLAKVEKPATVTREMLDRVHTPAYLDAVRIGLPRELAESQKFPWSPNLWPAVLLTNGAVLAAATQALDTGVSASVASGFHHASHDHGEGFCTFNGLVIAAEALRAAGRVKNVAVLDMDLHYGNGTALLANSRPWLRQLSLYGNDYWENVCYRDVSTQHHIDGPNHRSNPIPADSEWPALETLMLTSIPWLLDEARPDLLLYQAGADYLQDDPYSPLKLDHAALQARDHLVFSLTKERGIPVAWTLAGGYAKDVQKIVMAHTNTFRAAIDVYGRS